MKLSIAVIGILLMGLATAAPNPHSAPGSLEGWLTYLASQL